MFVSKATDDYDKIMLSFEERRILHRILKKGKVSPEFCNNQQRNVLLGYGLITTQSPTIVTSSGRVVADSSVLPFIYATDKAKRYFLYRREDYFKGKLPVVIALAALIISIISLILQFL